MAQKIICLYCGNEFIPSRNDSRIKYCSSDCKERNRWKGNRNDLNDAMLERYRKIVELYDSDYSTNEIAEMFGCSNTVVYSAWKWAKLPRRLTQQQKAVMSLRKQGKCCTEIADELGLSTRTINGTALAIGMPFTEEEKQRSILIGHKKMLASQYGGEEKRRQNQIDFISEHYPQFEYVSGYVSSDDYVELRCKECGTVFKRYAGYVRRVVGEINCPVCKEKHKQEEIAKREAEKEAQKQEQKRERIEAFWSQKFKQINFKMRQCKECGAFFIGEKGLYCSDECKRKHLNRKHDKRLDRAKRIDKSITLKKLYKRDKGVCWLCGKKCDYKDYTKDGNGYFIAGPNYPSVDHVFPLSKGGNHEWNNVKLAHCYCNTLKSDKVVAYG